MSIHITAPEGSIAPVVLMPGDPLRAKLIATEFLADAALVSSTRNIFYYTGLYKGHRISVGASGMGCPSIGIYSYELYSNYDVQHIIRIGTCGAYHSNLRLFDIINVAKSASESTFAKEAWGFAEEVMLPQGNAYAIINETAAARQQAVLDTSVHTSDYFYRANPELPAIAAAHQCEVVEMESFALFANARYLGKSAACLLTVSDIIPTQQKISPDQREQSLLPMIELALESAIRL